MIQSCCRSPRCDDVFEHHVGLCASIWVVSEAIATVEFGQRLCLPLKTAVDLAPSMLAE